MKTRQVRTVRLTVHQLEEVILPAAGWPFAGGPAMNPIVGTWGQYQDFKSGAWDNDIHLHEGLDIAARVPKEQVKAVADGFVLDIVKVAKDGGFRSAVVVSDTKVYDPQTTMKWTYLHVLPNPKLSITDEVKKGVTVIGTVVDFFPAAIAAGYPTHVHLNRGFGEDKSPIEGESGRKQQPIPKVNPLLEFDPALDGTAPTIDGIRFRPAGEDRFGTHKEGRIGSGVENEQFRTNGIYFKSTTTVNGETFSLVGKMPGQVAGTVGTSIDIVAEAYDRFGPAATPGMYKLNPATFSFDIYGRSFGGWAEDIASFNFKAISDPITSAGYFFNFNRTRSVYANNKASAPDPGSDSNLVGPYYYVVTNTKSQTSNFGTGGKFPENGSLNYWDTAAKIGQPWNAGTALPRAGSNAEAEFPDDLYNVKITAKDLSDNATSKTVGVLLDNWQQKIVKGAGEIQAKPLNWFMLAKAEQFRANQTLDFFAINANVPGAAPPNGTLLPVASKVGTHTTDAKGGLKNKALLAPGTAGDKWLVADYNGDGIFTPQLDAAIRITVKAAPAAKPIGAAPDLFGWTHGWALEVGAPGVMFGETSPEGIVTGDSSPDWANTVAVLDEGPQHGSLTFRPDGSFTYVADPAFAYDSFTYHITTGTESSGSVPVTLYLANDAPDAEPDLYAVVHGHTLHKSALDGVLHNDSDWDDDALSVVSTIQPEHGSVQVASDGSFDYAPPANFIGEDVFGYVVSDGTTTSTGWVTVDVTNNFPVAAVDVYSTLPNQTLSLPLAAGVRVNDIDEDGDAINVQEVKSTEHGTLVLGAEGSFTYTPNPGYVGYDWFAYKPTDGFADGSSCHVSILVTNGSLVGDKVWNDLDENGIQDPDEPGVPGQTVRLLDASGATVTETLTDNSGRFLFDVPPSSYRLQVVVPAGASVSPANVGDEDNDDSDIGSTGISDLFVLANGSAVYDIDAGLYGSVLPLPEPELSTLAGRVFVDANANGVLDESENGMGGVTVNLLDAVGLIVATTTTAIDGTYSFIDITPGQYRLQFVKPTGYEFTAADQGSDETTDSDVTDALAGTTDLFELVGGTGLDLTAGLVSGSPPPP